MRLITVPHKPGNCYSTCVELLLRNFKRHPSLKLIHGYPRLTGTKTRFGHSWLELEVKQEPRCVDPSNQSVLVHREIYYMLGRIEPDKCQIYTVDEAIELLEQYQHCGPWVETPKHVVFARKGKKHARKLQ